MLILTCKYNKTNVTNYAYLTTQAAIEKLQVFVHRGQGSVTSTVNDPFGVETTIMCLQIKKKIKKKKTAKNLQRGK